MHRLLLLGLLAANPRWEFLVTNLDVFPGTDQFFESDSRLFWRLRPNLRDVAAAERLPDGSTYRFTASTGPDGRRVTPPVNAAESRVLFLGDSSTFGIPVGDAEAFPAVVQRLVPGLAAINAGVPGYSAFQGRRLLEHLAEMSDAPRFVIAAFWPNDRSTWDHLSDPEHAQLLDGAFTPRLTVCCARLRRLRARG
jgi:hypothetical protein